MRLARWRDHRDDHRKDRHERSAHPHQPRVGCATHQARRAIPPSKAEPHGSLEAGPAREQVDRALDELQDRFTERYYGPLFGALQQRYRHTAQEGVKRLLKKELKGLGETERAAIETWAEVLARRFAHIPSLGLRGLLHDGPDGSVEAFLNGLEPEFADELRAALRGAAAGPRDAVPAAPAARARSGEA